MIIIFVLQYWLTVVTLQLFSVAPVRLRTIMAINFTNSQQPALEQPRKKSTGKFGLTFKKVGKYLRDQAQDQSHSGIYLSPTPRQPHRGSRSDDLDDEELIQKLAAQAGYNPGISRLVRTPSGHSPTRMGANSPSGPGVFRNMKRHQYDSDNILQSYDVLVPERALSQSSSDSNVAKHDAHGCWLVYVHGGYFRDPKVDSTSFKPAIKIIEESDTSNFKQNISGYASINYRLAPHQAYPQDTSTSSSYTLNNASWPDQPNDVLNAIRHLHRTYPDSASNYILIGHSVGATLVFLAALQCADAGIKSPKAVVGVSGIYNFPAIHVTNPDYEDMTKNGMASKFYKEASPALYSADTYREKWPEQKRGVVLAHSKDDGLVVWDQVEEMEQVFQGQNGFSTELIELKGAHNDIWGQGKELVRTIQRTLEMVASSG